MSACRCIGLEFGPSTAKLSCFGVQWRRNAGNGKSLARLDSLGGRGTGIESSSMTGSVHMVCVLSALVSSLSLSPPASAFVFQLQTPPAQLLQRSQLCTQGAQRRLAWCSLPTRLAASKRTNICRLRSANDDSMDDMHPEEAMVERLLERIETGMESAVSQERFKEASALRDEVSRMHMDDTSTVLKVGSLCLLDT